MPATTPPPSEPSNASPAATENLQLPADPSQFEGDYFGTNYTEDDFAPPISEPDSESEVDNEEETAPGPDHESWEPNPDPVPEGQDEDPMDEVSQEEERRDRSSAEDRLHSSPITIKRYRGRAGEIVGRVSAAGYLSYSEQNRENPWAPFSSKMDWEVARWAKLRGPGSTSFTELLGIEGVRANPQLCLIPHLIFHSYPTRWTSHTKLRRN